MAHARYHNINQFIGDRVLKECVDCGALVLDQQVHDQHHKELDNALSFVDMLHDKFLEELT